ncbi:MAG: hypothetical protein K6G15_00260 [Desulfovibrio sp.]|nr:hypothetical protein [Desulfovibrio sp.]
MPMHKPWLALRQALRSTFIVFLERIGPKEARPWPFGFAFALSVFVWLIAFGAMYGTCLAQSLEETSACLAMKNCAGSYGERVRAMQGALLSLYERALQEGQGKEHMANLEDCLEELSQVFRYHAAEITLPGVEDVVRAAQSLLEEVCAGLCRNTLQALAQEKRAWMGIWDDLHHTLFRRAEDWTKITRSLEVGNVELGQTMRSRLRELMR